jgi:hypothetical protein
VWYAPKKIVIDKEIFRTCGASLRLQPDGSDLLRQFFSKKSLKSKTRYKLSFFVKLQDVSGGKVAPKAGFRSDLRFMNGGAGSVFYPFKQALMGTIPWTRFEFEFTTPENTGKNRDPYIGFYLDKNCKNGKVWLDHIELVEVEK